MYNRTKRCSDILTQGLELIGVSEVVGLGLELYRKKHHSSITAEKR